MLDKIAALCNFNYTIKLVDDGFHGAYVNGKWNGIVSELIDKVTFLNKSLYLIFLYFIFSFKNYTYKFDNKFFKKSAKCCYMEQKSV